MKKIYSQPELTTHGSIETLTQVTGSSTAADVLSFNGFVTPNTDGSNDIVLP